VEILLDSATKKFPHQPIEFHSRIILQKFIQRSLIRISSEIIEESYDETTDVLTC
jgi:hypothetical protein